MDEVLTKVDALKPIASELGVPLSQLAIGWCASNPNVSSVITGATKEAQVSFSLVFRQLWMKLDEIWRSVVEERRFWPKWDELHIVLQVIENMKSLEVLPKLTPEVLEKIESIVQSKPKVIDQYR